MNTDYILYYLSKTKKIMHQYVDQQLKADGVLDIVPSYCDVLTALFMNDGKLKMHEISEMVGKDKSTVTVLVNRLIERGYILKEKSELDRRVTYIKLTEKSLDQFDLFNNIKDNVRNVAYDGFKETEKKQMMDYLDRICDNFGQALKK